MEIDENNQQLVKADLNSVVLSRPGQLLTRMTTDLLPLAHSKRILDDQEAEPSFSRGIKAFEQKNFQLAIRELNVAAELGHQLAQFKLAVMYLDGIGEPSNHELAYHWFHRAAEQGDADSLNKLGWMCEAGFGVERDQARAVNWFRQAAERGHLEAQFNLAVKYDNGEGVAQNHAEAARWYRLAAEQGLADARFFLAQALEFGEGVPKNIEEALDWYILATEQGHPSAKVTLWGHALAERYVPEDEVEKVFIERLGVEMQYPLAEYKYAYRLFVGEGVSKCVETSLDLYHKAASKGFGAARAHLVLIYSLEFEGVDYVKLDPTWNTQEFRSELFDLKPRWMYLESGATIINALNLFRRKQRPSAEGGDEDLISLVNDVTLFREHRLGAEGGDEDLIIILAGHYYSGWGTLQNFEKALEWLRKGVAINDVDCNYRIGCMLQSGIGISRDEKNALLHLKKAAKGGIISANRLVAELLLEGQSDLKKVKQAIKLLERLAKKGDVNSQFMLGDIYSNGEHLPVDHQKAVSWYSKAADKGHTAALFNLGIKFEHGWGVDKDPQRALTLYRSSADGGLIRACEELSQIYLKGRFGEQSTEDSDYWSAQAHRLRAEAEKPKRSSQVPGHTTLTSSARRKRLEQKRSLQRKSSEMIRKG